MHPSYIDLDTIINSYTPPLPKELQKAEILTPHPDKGKSHKISKDIKTLFPHTCDLPYIRFSPGKPSPAGPLKVGVMLSGGPAPGGHNVIQGLLDSLKKFHQNSQLIGFLNDGEGLTNNNAINITKEFLYKFRNSGGFNCLGTGRKKHRLARGKRELSQNHTCSRSRWAGHHWRGRLKYGNSNPCRVSCKRTPKNFSSRSAKNYRWRLAT